MRLKRKVKRITIDLDPTDDPTHGAQQLTFFNGHYRQLVLCDESPKGGAASLVAQGHDDDCRLPCSERGKADLVFSHQ
jgi:hypothetical protein